MMCCPGCFFVSGRGYGVEGMHLGGILKHGIKGKEDDSDDYDDNNDNDDDNEGVADEDDEDDAHEEEDGDEDDEDDADDEDEDEEIELMGMRLRIRNGDEDQEDDDEEKENGVEDEDVENIMGDEDEGDDDEDEEDRNEPCLPNGPAAHVTRRSRGRPTLRYYAALKLPPYPCGAQAAALPYAALARPRSIVTRPSNGRPMRHSSGRSALCGAPCSRSTTPSTCGVYAAAPLTTI